MSNMKIVKRGTYRLSAKSQKTCYREREREREKERDRENWDKY